MSQRTLAESPYLNSNLFSSHYLDERIRDLDEWECDEEAAEAMEDMWALFVEQRDIVAAYDEDNLRTDWIDPVLTILGHHTISETPLHESGGFIDRLLFDSNEARMDAVHLRDEGQTRAMYGRGTTVLEAKQWHADFEQRFHENRQYRDASHQIKYYLERTPESIQWGILTNGRKWRLYGTKDYETQTFYEVDLPELLEDGDVEAFKYFFTFFRAAAFREVDGTSFLDRVWSESETAAQELGEDLQNNVFTALRVLGEGFVESNDLDIEPGDEEALRELKEQSLVLLYRLMFVLYAEARGLIHPDSGDADREYEENFSLDRLRIEIHEIVEEGEPIESTYSAHSTSLWSRISDLFRLIDGGNDDLGIPAYNGGLFDRGEHTFLAENEVSDRYLAEVIHRLSTTDSNGGSVLADYADLDTRHLGSIYEGLLEHQFRLAGEDLAAVREDGGQVWKPTSEVTVAEAIEEVESGELYVVNDEGERKATGAYYTPDYVVTYIVEETVGPLIEDIRKDLEEEGFQPGSQEYVFQFGNRVLDLTVLDPAMGSGHFLTKATGYLAEQVQEAAREAEIEDVMREEQVRRQVAKEVIYGVDINPMAVELAKLSMWLETLAADQPLAFLDHHLKVGNSLVGSDIEAIEGLETDAGDGDQSSLADFGAVRRGTIEHLMDVYQEFLAIENEDLADVKAMERKYAEIEQDELRQRLVAMANVHTAEGFGVDVPGGAYERMAEALEDEEKWMELHEADWFTTAQEICEEWRSFHWKLEYPEAFFDESGDRKTEPGFDAVIGNPPYIKIHNLRKTASPFADYSIETYETGSGRFDIYGLFVERGAELARDSRVTYILPNKFFESGGGKPLREFIGENNLLSEVVDFGRHQVFEGVTTYTCILSLAQGEDSFEYGKVNRANGNELRSVEKVLIPNEELDRETWVLTGPVERRVLKKLRDRGQPIGGLSTYLSEGIVSGDNDVLFVDVLSQSGDISVVECTANGEEYRIETDILKPLLRGDHIERFGGTETDEAVIYPYEWIDGHTEPIPESRLANEFPLAYSYLQEFKERLSNRGTDSMRYRTWYALYRPREKPLFDSRKIITPDVCGKCEFTLDDEGGLYLPNSGYGIVPNRNDQIHRDFLLGVLDSAPTWFFIYHTSPILRGDYRRFMTSYLSPLPIPEVAPEETDRRLNPQYSEAVEAPTDFENRGRHLADLARIGLELSAEHKAINLNLPDYLGNYSDGSGLTDLDGYQPPSGVAESILAERTESREKLRVGDVEINESGETLTLLATARYKPDDEDDHELDPHGYTETDPIPAMEFHGLSEAQSALVREFVPYAVDEEIAGFRENAAKSISLLDRLEALTLPKLEDVEEGLERFLDNKAEAVELDEKIQRTDDLIDQIVYELYGLTDEEIEIVEEAVGS